MGQKELNMRQKRWLELLKDYDCITEYHLRKANVVADALCQKMGKTTTAPIPAHLKRALLSHMVDMRKMNISMGT